MMKTSDAQAVGHETISLKERRWDSTGILGLWP